MAGGSTLKLIDYPLFVIVGQTFRVIVETPADTPALEVEVPPTLELFDRGPLKAEDTVQRFYFRAKGPGPAPITFRGTGDELKLSLRVLTWEEVLEPRRFENHELPRIWPIGRSYERLKPRHTLLADAEIAAMRQPGRETPEELASLKLDEIYDSLLGSYVPRNVFVNHLNDRRGCPRCGMKIYEGRNAFYPWLLDPRNHPCKVGCPECGEWFPTNDYASGDMSSGDIVDDGHGVDMDGYRLSFIGYYNVWHYLKYYVPMVRNLAREYAHTGDHAFARKTAVGLLRVTEQYLNLAINLNQRKRISRETLWNVPMGILPREDIPVYETWMYVEGNWEVPRVHIISEIYELIFDALQEPDEELLRFCQQHHHPEIRTMEDFRRFIETGYFRTMAQSCLDKNVVGNLPQGQRALMELALLLGTPETGELVDWTFNGGGQMRFFLTNHYFKDGSAYESQGYNAGHVYNLQAIVDVMEELRDAQPEVFNADKFPALAEDPKYKQLFDFPIDFSLIGRTHAQTGDAGDLAKTDTIPVNQSSDISPNRYERAYALTRERRFAQVLHGPDDKYLQTVSDPGLAEEIRRVAAEDGWEVRLESNVTDGYGHAILRSGQGDARRALWVRYGRSRGHGHNDMLTIGLEALQRKLLPELGYPHSWQFAGLWEGHWATHYCAFVRGDEKRPGRKGTLALFSMGEGVQVAAARAPSYVYGEPPRPYRLLTDQVFERVLALIDLSPEDFYAVDVFRVSGGKEHWWSLHGPRGDVDYEGTGLKPQEGGTALGSDVPYGKPRETDSGLSALAYMDNVERGRTEGPWVLDFRLEGYPDIHLRTTVLSPDGAELILAEGHPPGGGNPYNVQWALLSNRGEEGFRSTFAQVLEAYEGKRVLDEVEPVPIRAIDGESSWASGVRVRSDERTDTIIFNHDPSEPCITEGKLEATGSFAFWSEDADGLRALFLTQGTCLKKGEVELSLPVPAHEARIIAVDYRNWKLVIAPSLSSPKNFVGRYFRVVNDGGNDTAFRIETAKNVNDGTEITVDVDPRIGEGYAVETGPNLVIGNVTLPLGNWRYYHGKTLTNEDGTVVYRTSGCYRKTGFFIDPDRHGKADADLLHKQFVAPEGQPPKRYVVYDYGVGDTVILAHSVEVRRTDGGFHVKSTTAGEARFPQIGKASIAPGESVLR